MPTLLHRSPFKQPSLAAKAYLGIDPGANGGIAVITGQIVTFHQFGDGDAADWDFIARYIGVDCAAAIEQQTPRPTFIPPSKKARSEGRTDAKNTILASTCHLFGHYRALQAILVCACIPVEDCPPKRWQAALQIPKKIKGESDSCWKNRLKSKAEALYPVAKITLATADALLIAHYCKRKDQ